MWEYKIETITYRMYSELIDALNIEGKDYWELISVKEEKEDKYNSKTSVTILFKRKIKPT